MARQKIAAHGSPRATGSSGHSARPAPCRSGNAAVPVPGAGPITLTGPDPLAGTGWPEHVAELAAGRHLEMLAAVEGLRAQGRTIHPARGDVFRALCATPWNAVRVVILGQDPYHGPGQAHGLAFSVPDGMGLPRSLRNIFREVAADAGDQPARPAGGASPGMARPMPPGAALAAPTGVCSGNLLRWAAQGVLLLNTVLTVESGQPNSHAGLGWEAVTRGMVAALGARPQPCAFLLWGRSAQGFADLVTHPAHLVLMAAHPSPLSASRGFFGCGHFSRVNAWLRARGEAPVRWQAGGERENRGVGCPESGAAVGVIPAKRCRRRASGPCRG